MNIKRLVVSIVVGFIVYFFSEFAIHGLWLQKTYTATAELWRTDAEMTNRFPQMLAGQFLFTATFVIIWALGFAQRGSAKTAIKYGLLMGLFNQATTLITFVVSPLPAHLAVKWFVAGIIQAVLLALIVNAIYRPQPGPVHEQAGSRDLN